MKSPKSLEYEVELFKILRRSILMLAAFSTGKQKVYICKRIRDKKKKIVRLIIFNRMLTTQEIFNEIVSSYKKNDQI